MPYYKLKNQGENENWITILANSPEEAEYKFRQVIAYLLTRGTVKRKRLAASRLAKKDFEVEVV